MHTSNDAILRVENYGFTYPDQTKSALHDIHMELLPGSFTILCGTSGCGKSTFLRQLKPVLRPHGSITGNIIFLGHALSRWDDRTLSASIGFVMQDPDAQIVTDKVWHELAFGLESLGFDTDTIRLRVAEMASYFGIQQWFYKNVDELSGGQKQLLNLAAIMAMHPSLLILDEPTSQLDPIAAGNFLETIRKINRELGTTILMTEHRLEEVFPMADRILLMDEGTILCDAEPRTAGLWMYEHAHPMFRAMPAPLQIYAENESRRDKENAPLTVREGREWLNRRIAENSPAEASHGSPAYTPQNSASGTCPTHDAAPLLELQDVWFRYDRDLPDVLRATSFSLYPGEIYGLLGGNGSGKSTMLSLMARVRKPYRGRILLDGRDIRKYSDYELYRGFLGVIPQNPQSLFVKKTVELELYEMIGGRKEVISEEFPIDMEKKRVVEEIAALTHLSPLMDHHPYDLSGGEQQRLALAKILLLRPRLLLMDEPTKGMDACFKEEFAGILRQLTRSGITVFLISHDIEFCARYADRCGMFFDGHVVTENETVTFFAGNTFYTTSTNRMVRHLWPEVIVPKQVAEHLQTDTDLFPEGNPAREVKL